MPTNGLYDSGAGLQDTAVDDQALLCVGGAVALDTQARTAIKAALQQAGINLVSERLLPAGSAVSSGTAGSSLQSSTPRLVLLVSTTAGTEEGLEELLDENLIPNFGACFTISTDPSEFEALFPPIQEADSSTAPSPAGNLQPDHEKRVFTFDSEEQGSTSTRLDEEEEEEEEEEDNDVVAEQLLAPSRMALTSTRTPLGQSMSASSSNRGTIENGGEQPRAPSATGEVSNRPGSAFKARKAPSSTTVPSIQPRLSKAAALRMGIDLPQKRTQKNETDENDDPVQIEEVLVPGTVRRAVTPPKSLSKPVMPPKQNRASALRANSSGDTDGPLVRPPTKRRESVGTSQRSAGFEGLPGFAKRISQPASPKRDEWTSSPGQNRSSLLRQKSQDGYLAPLPKPTKRRESLTTAERAALFSRGRPSLDYGSSSSLSVRSGTASQASTSRPSLSREASENGSSTVDQDRELESATRNLERTTLSPARPPSIVPRPNKAAELRLAAQKAARA